MATKRTVQPDNDKMDAETLAMLKTKVLRANVLQAQIDALKDEFDTLNEDILDVLLNQPVQIDRVEFDEVRASVVRTPTVDTTGWTENHPRFMARLIGYGRELERSKLDERALKASTSKACIERAIKEDTTGAISQLVEESTVIKTALKITRK